MRRVVLAPSRAAELSLAGSIGMGRGSRTSFMAGYRASGCEPAEVRDAAEIWASSRVTFVDLTLNILAVPPCVLHVFGFHGVEISRKKSAFKASHLLIYSAESKELYWAPRPPGSGFF